MVDQRQVTPQVAIVVDSSACLPACLVEQWKITVVPHTLIIDGVPLQDGVDIQPTDFYRLLRLGQKDVTTSAPNSNAFLQALTSAHELAPDVLCIVVASRFSAAYETAKVAAVTACQSTPGLRVHVMDSRTAAGACALLALDAAQAANSGLPLDFIVQRAEHAIPGLRLLATLDDLSYLRASGRVSWLGLFRGLCAAHQPRVRAAPRRTPPVGQAPQPRPRYQLHDRADAHNGRRRSHSRQHHGGGRRHRR